MKPKVLFTSSVISYPPVGGPELRIENSVKALSLVSDVHLFVRLPEKTFGGERARQHFGAFTQTLKILSAPCRYDNSLPSLARRAVNGLCKLAGVAPRFYFGGGVEQEGQELLAFAKACDVDMIWMGYGNVSYPLLKYIKAHSDLPVVSDTDSVWSRFLLRELPFAVDDAAKKRIQDEGDAKAEEERWGANLADVTTAVSEVDATYYRGLATDDSKVHLFSNVIDPTSYSPCAAPDGFVSPSVFMAGSFYQRNCPMEDAARWFIEEVWAHLQEQVPNIHLYIIGRGSDVILEDINIEGVSVMGEVDSVLPYLYNTVAALVPLRFESGTRFKILEAGVCNAAVVSTTLGAEGLDVKHNTHLLFADDGERFAEAIASLVKNPTLGSELAKNLNTYIIEHNSVESLAGEAQAILKYLNVSVGE